MSRADRSQETEVLWTASRCNRTLRQLTAFLAKIEKWHKDFSDKHLFQNAELSKDLASLSRMGSNAEESKMNDPKWIFRQDRQSRKKAEKSYAGRRRALQDHIGRRQPKCLPHTPRAPKTVEVIVDTPLMTGILSSPNLQSSVLKNEVQICGLELKAPRRPQVPLLPWSRTEKAGRGANPPSLPKWSSATINEMRQIITSFLAATSQTRTICDEISDELYRRKGPKSLFSSCLRRIPSIILSEQAHYDENPDGYDGEVQVAAVLLTDLEDHYGDPQKGWGPLRIVTRGYGIALICNAIRKGSLPVEAAMALASSLVNDFGVNEVTRAIAEATLDGRQISSADDLSRILVACVDGGHAKDDAGPLANMVTSDAAALRFRLVNTVFNQAPESVPRGLVSTQPALLRDAIRSCSRGRQSDAVSLVKTLLLHFLDLLPGSAEASTTRVRNAPKNILGGFQDEALDPGDLLPEKFLTASVPTTSLTSIFQGSIVALAAFPIAREMRHRESKMEQVRNSLAECASVCIFRDISLAIQVDMEVFGVTHLTPEQLQRRAWILFAYNLLATILLLPKASHSLSDSLVNLILSHASRTGVVTSLSSFVLEVLMACNLAYERRKRVHRFDMFKEITDSLVRRTSCQPAAVALLFSNIAVEASMAYAQIGGKDNADALLWATELQQRAQASLKAGDPTLLTPSFKTSATRFRWDDCIAEWVAETPSAAEMYPSQLRPGLQDDKSWRSVLFGDTGLPTPPVSIPVSPIDDSILRCLKKRKSLPEQAELYWDGDFAFKRRAKKSKSLGGEMALPKSLIDAESEDELGGCC